MFCKTADNLNVYYDVQGNPQATETLVFLNGLTQSTQSWSLMLPYFKKEYKIILLDFIFQGQSDKTGNWRNFDEHAADVKRVLDTEKLTQTTIIGLSYGSLVAQHFAVNYPASVKKLILLSTFAHKTAYYEAVELSWWRALETGGYNLLLDIMMPSVLSEGYFANPLIPISAMKEMRRESNQSAEAIFSLMKATKEREDYRTNLEKIKCPALVIQGEKDLLLPVHLASEVQRHLKHGRLIVIKHAGHTLNLEHLPEVCTHMSAFLKQVE